jgi:hypothetical protein
MELKPAGERKPSGKLGDKLAGWLRMDTQKSLQWIVGVFLIIVGADFSTFIASADVCDDLNRIESARL